MQQQQNIPQEVQNLIDPSTPFDQTKLNTLDQLTNKMISGKCQPAEMTLVNKIWESFKGQENWWLNTDFIITNSQEEYTKFYTLITLEDAISKRWNTFPQNQKEGLKKYMIDMVIAQGSKSDLSQSQNNTLSKCNSILIAILKYEWNTTWQSFIPDICAASKQNESLCKNNLKLLRMLSEEIFDYSKNTLTSQKIKEMKENFQGQFQEVYDLCTFITKTFLQSPDRVRPDLIKENLETLYSFLSWIPLAYIFFTDILEVLTNLLQYPNLRPIAIKCLSEVVSLPIEDDDQDKIKIQEKIFNLYKSVLTKIQTFMPCDISLQSEVEKIRNNHSQSQQLQDLSTQLALYFTSFFNTHLHWVQTQINGCNNDNKLNLLEDIRKGLTYIVMFNELKDEESIFKICAEFWVNFTENLNKDPLKNQQQGGQLLNLGFGGSQQMTLQQNIYPNILTNVRKIIISRMARPNQVLIKVDEDDVVREEVKDTEQMDLYVLLRQLLINLTKHDWECMKLIMSNKLDRQLDGSEWSWDNINSISWAIGSISGTLPDSDEKSFLIVAIRTLLNLCEQRKGKQNKAIVASNIMYVVGQYPKFLKANWNFLKTVVKKLFEFMKESFPGVMEMAVNTFLEISKKCKDEFVKQQNQNSNMQDQEPYIYELIRKIPDETSMLVAKDKLVFYEAIGHMISSEPNQEIQAKLIDNVCQQIYAEFQQIVNRVQQQDGDTFIMQREVMESLHFNLKVSERLAFSVGYSYAVAFVKIFDWTNSLYRYFGEKIKQEIQTTGKVALNYHTVKQRRIVKRLILMLMQTFLQHCKKDNPQCNQQYVLQNLFIPFQQTILSDYIDSDQDLKEPEVLSIYQIIFENMPQQIGQTGLVPQILQGIFDPTLPMIQTDFNSFPEIREKFFHFLKAVVNNAIEALFNIPPNQFKTVIDCVIWASKHQLNNLFMIGLEVLLFIFKNVNTNPQIANQFYSIYYMNILKDSLEIITDGYHKSGFSLQYQIIALLIEIVETGLLTTPVNQQEQGNTDNKTYVSQFLINVLSSAFSNVSQQQTQHFVQLWFQTCRDHSQFKIHMRDYLINLQQYSVDNEHLFKEESNNNTNGEQQQQQQQQK